MTRLSLRTLIAAAGIAACSTTFAQEFEEVGTPGSVVPRSAVLEVESDSFGIVEILLPEGWASKWPDGYIPEKQKLRVEAGSTWISSLKRWARDVQLDTSVDWTAQTVAFNSPSAVKAVQAERAVAIHPEQSSQTMLASESGESNHSGTADAPAEGETSAILKTESSNSKSMLQAITVINAPNPQLAPQTDSDQALRTYMFEKGQKFSTGVAGWLKSEGWTLIWKPNFDWQIPVDTPVQAADVLDALEIVSAWIAAEGQPVRFNAYKGNKMVIAESFGPAQPSN